MLAEIISIGDELTSGQRLDTNSQWLAEQLGDLGVKTMYHTTVADDLAANVRVMAEAIDRVDIVVVTGGLGPTADDLTRDAVAQVAGVQLVLDQPSLDHIRQMFSRHKRPMPERNAVQAMFPGGSQVIFNRQGSAPGIDIQLQSEASGRKSRLFALPGVPAEMKEMFAATVAPAIAAMRPEPRVIRHYRIKCFGAGESAIEAMMPDLIARQREPIVGITVHAATITLRITTSGKDDADCRAQMQPTIETIRSCLGDLVYGEEDDELEDAVLAPLQTAGKTLTTVEIGTQGLMAHWLAQAAGKYGQRIVSQVLSAPAGIDPCSREYAEQLAIEQRAATDCDYCLAISDFPEPTESQQTAPSYHFALASRDKVAAASGTLVSHAAIWHPRAVKQALNLLRLTLLRK